MSPKDNKEPVWDEFPFDQNDKMELDEDSISTNSGDNMLEFGVSFSFDQSDNEVEANLKVHKAPDIEELDGVLEQKSDLVVHEADYHLVVEQCHHMDDVGCETRDNHGVIEHNNVNSNFKQRPEEIIEYGPIYDIDHF